MRTRAVHQETTSFDAIYLFIIIIIMRWRFNGDRLNGGLSPRTVPRAWLDDLNARTVVTMPLSDPPLMSKSKMHPNRPYVDQ